MGKIRKRFGRSGAFRRKQSGIVEQIIKTYKSAVQRNENQIMVSDDVETHNIEPEVVFVLHAESVLAESVVSQKESELEINIKNSHDDKINSRDFPFDEMKFKSALATWAVNNGIKLDHLRELLRIWNENVPLSPLPNDPRTLLDTPRTVTIKNNYWHRGLKIALIKMLSKCVNV